MQLLGMLTSQFFAELSTFTSEMIPGIFRSISQLVQGVYRILDTEFPDFFMVFPTLDQHFFTSSLVSVLLKPEIFEIYLDFDTFFKFTFLKKFPCLLI